MNNKKTKLIIVVAIVLVAAAFVLPKLFNGSTPLPIANAPSASVTSIVVAKSVDAKGNPVGVSTVFSSTKDKQIYVFLALKNTTKKTTLAYTRYLNGKFIDSKVIHPTTDGASYAYFAFEKGIGNYPKGNYRVVSYVNGKRSVETTYSFQ